MAVFFGVAGACTIVTEGRVRRSSVVDVRVAGVVATIQAADEELHALDLSKLGTGNGKDVGIVDDFHDQLLQGTSEHVVVKETAGNVCIVATRMVSSTS